MKLSEAGKNTYRQVKNIIFDWGGVITNLDYDSVADAFRKFGLVNFESHFSHLTHSELFRTFEKGEISESEFRSMLRKHIPGSISDVDLDHAWSAILKDTPVERIKILQEVRKNYFTLLLSNTNSIHVSYYDKLMNSVYNIPSMESLFDKAYYSYKLGMRKPDAEIFEFVLKESNLIPEETILIDDTFPNIETAEKLGIHCIYLNDISLTDIFEN